MKMKEDSDTEGIREIAAGSGPRWRYIRRGRDLCFVDWSGYLFIWAGRSKVRVSK